VIAIRRPPWLGDCPPFIGQGGSSLQACHTISPTCRGMAYNAAELTVVLANLAPAGASWRVLCPYGSVFEGSGVEVGCPAAARGRLEGGVNGRPYEVQWRPWRHPVSHPNLKANSNA
jgi:hypothetical protein